MDGGSVISGEDASSFFISNYPKHKEIYTFANVLPVSYTHLTLPTILLV